MVDLKKTKQKKTFSGLSESLTRFTKRNVGVGHSIYGKDIVFVWEIPGKEWKEEKRKKKGIGPRRGCSQSRVDYFISLKNVDENG